MALTLHFHPLSSYCHKVLIALYENDTPFTPRLVDLMNPEERAALVKLWPIGKFPLLHDSKDDRLIPESSIIIEYLDRHYPGRTRFLPADPDEARQTRLRDRFMDLHVHDPMQKIVGDRLRPQQSKDPYGVEHAKARLVTAYAMLDREIEAKGDAQSWAMGDAFTLADCAAAPALFYANMLVPFERSHRHLAAYFARLNERPSYARTLKEAEPYLAMVPKA